MRRFAFVSAVLCNSICVVGAHAAVRHITDPASKAPFSLATAAGDFIYVTGNGGAGDDVAAQTNSALDRIAATLKNAGADLGDVAQTTVYLTDQSKAAEMEQAYSARFTKNPPARILIISAALVGGRGLVEINATAVRHGLAHSAVLPKGWQKPSGAFSYAQKVGSTLFISGLTAGNSGEGAAPPDNIGAQTRVIMDNMGAVLKAAGMDYNDLASGRVWIGDIKKNFAGMNAVYRTYFVHDFPARATLEFGMANPADLVEISWVAVKGGSRHAVLGAVDADGKQGKLNPNYSAAVAAGNRMWVTGMTGQTADNMTDVSSQAQETLTRMLRTLEAGGFTQDQIVEINCYLRDAKDVTQFQQMNEGYRKVFQKGLPARTTVQAANADGALVEISMMAVR
jgi:2-iminobutanoate/2-iminopropanoate deaminase